MQTGQKREGSSEESPSEPPATARQRRHICSEISFDEGASALLEQLAELNKGQVSHTSSCESRDTIMDDATQQSTQPYNDPRRLGRNNSGMSDHDVVDVICLLHPTNPLALEVVKNMMAVNPRHVLQNDDLLDGFDPDDLQMNMMMQSPSFERDLALRMSSKLKNPASGFTFGRNSVRCDIVLADDKDKNISNVHFSIHLNEHGILMLEDLSTNGTAVEKEWYKKTAGPRHAKTMLQPNVSIEVITRSKEPISFMVRYPPRGEYTEAYNQRLRDYIKEQPGMEGTTIIPSVSTYDTNYGMHWNGGSEYNVVGHLGKGAFATVYKLATKNDGKVFAAKELDKRRFMKNGILDLKVDNEMKIMSSLRHPNIVQYEGYHDHNHWIYIIMEFIPGGELSSHIAEHGAIHERVGQDITRQILHALDYLHTRKITHRDIKPDNILIANHQPLTVKLSDFGLSKCVTNQETFLKTFCGTLLYCAPEVYPDYSNYRATTIRKRHRGDPPSKTSPYSQAVDMWSFGAVLYHVLSNKPPVMGKGDERGIHMLNNIMTKNIDYDPLRTVHISEEGIEFISALLDRDPNMRPNEQMCFQHKWIVNVADHFDYSKLEDDFPPEYYEGLATVDELDEDIWNDSEAPEYFEGKENIVPDAGDEEMHLVDDRLDHRYQSKRQRLRGGGQIEQTFAPQGDVPYPSLPKMEASTIKSPNGKRGQRLFGEIPQSAIRSSGIFGQDQNEVADLPALRKSVEKISVNDWIAAGGETSAQSDLSADTDIPYQTRNPVRTGPYSAAASLFGAESDFRGLNMASPEAYHSQGTTPDTGNPASPETREATPADTEPLQKVDSNKMAPPPLPAAGRRRSAPKVDEMPVPGPLRQESTIPDTMINTSSRNATDMTAADVNPAKDERSENTVGRGDKATAQDIGDRTSSTRSSQPANGSSSAPGNPVLPIPARLGRLITIPGSLLTTEYTLVSLRTVYGRGKDSTIKYPNIYDARIPKMGLKLTFHSTDILDLESYLRTPGNTFSSISGLYVSVTTSATKGIWVNGAHLPHQDSRPGGWYWGKIMSGDVVTLYEGEAKGGKAGEKEYLRFRVEIYYGDSARMRIDGGEDFKVMWTKNPRTGTTMDNEASAVAAANGGKEITNEKEQRDRKYND